KEQPDARVIMVGGDGVSYGARLPSGTWREKMLAELAGQLDLSRVHFVGKVAYEGFLRLLQRSDTHVYLTYPFVASWSLREAMAAGCAIVGSATAPVEEFLEDGVTGRLVPFTEPDRIAEGVLELLNDTRTAKKMRQAARAEAEQTLCMKVYLAQYEELIAELIAAHKPASVQQDAAVQSKQPRKAKATVRKASGKAKVAAAKVVESAPVKKAGRPAAKARQPEARKVASTKGADAKKSVPAQAKATRVSKRTAQRVSPTEQRASKPAKVAPARAVRTGGRRKKADLVSS
ncbi:MAG: glycosyltransferase, partial [Acetobacter malorum]